LGGEEPSHFLGLGKEAFVRKGRKRKRATLKESVFIEEKGNRGIKHQFRGGHTRRGNKEALEFLPE